jgi:hypothetical protein
MTAYSSIYTIVLILLRLLCGPFPVLQSFVHSFDGHPYLKSEVVGSILSLALLAVADWAIRRIPDVKRRTIFLISAYSATAIVFCALTGSSLTTPHVEPSPKHETAPVSLSPPHETKTPEPIRCSPEIAKTLAKGWAALESADRRFAYSPLPGGALCEFQIKTGPYIRRKGTVKQPNSAHVTSAANNDTEDVMVTSELGAGAPPSFEQDQRGMVSAKAQAPPASNDCVPTAQVYGERLSETRAWDRTQGFLPTYSSANLSLKCRQVFQSPLKARPLPEKRDPSTIEEIEH